MKKKFWISTSRQFYKEETVTVDDDMDDGELEDMLIEWCERVFPRFHFTDAWIKYGVKDAK